MLKGFKGFIFRGNVVDLAVGVVMGAAFTAVISQLTKSFLEPLIKLMGGGGATGGTFVVNDVIFDYGAFINAVITFLLTAFAIYFFVVLPLNAYMSRRTKKEDTVPEKLSAEIILLQEIRDALNRRA